ncbi:MAG: pilus assembly PilX N-terminal domain-containing protein [Candidatus Omnitrophota bacterium]|jgi:hypothetical protein
MKIHKKNRKGMVLILTFIILTTLTAIIVGFMYLASTQLKGSGYDAASQKALWLAEAGIEKALWYLKTPVANGGYGENWITDANGITENFGGGTYTIVVTSWNFALAANGAVASDSPVQTNEYTPDKAIDNESSTFWESKGYPGGGNNKLLIIKFPYPLSLYKVGFTPVPLWNNPTEYYWFISIDGKAWSAWIQTGQTSDVLTPKVNWLRLDIRQVATPGKTVRIATVTVTGRKIRSTGTVNGISRTVERVVVAKEWAPMQTGYGFFAPNWNETD